MSNIMEKKRKILNNKVNITACGKNLIMRLSDKELCQLRSYSNYSKDRDWKNINSGGIYNFSLYALFDYEIKSSSKRNRIYKNFRYHDFNTAFWYLV